MPARHLSSVLLPEPLRPTMPKNSPWRDVERDVLERLQPVRRRAAEGMQGALLERVDLLVGKAELLRHALHDDGERTRHGGERSGRRLASSAR